MPRTCCQTSLSPPDWHPIPAALHSASAPGRRTLRRHLPEAVFTVPFQIFGMRPVGLIARQAQLARRHDQAVHHFRRHLVARHKDGQVIRHRQQAAIKHPVHRPAQRARHLIHKGLETARRDQRQKAARLPRLGNHRPDLGRREIAAPPGLDGFMIDCPIANPLRHRLEVRLGENHAGPRAGRHGSSPPCASGSTLSSPRESRLPSFGKPFVRAGALRGGLAFLPKSGH